jgi:hypothetical protein
VGKTLFRDYHSLALTNSTLAGAATSALFSATTFEIEEASNTLPAFFYSISRHVQHLRKVKLELTFEHDGDESTLYEVLEILETWQEKGLRLRELTLEGADLESLTDYNVFADVITMLLELKGLTSFEITQYDDEELSKAARKAWKKVKGAALHN